MFVRAKQTSSLPDLKVVWKNVTLNTIVFIVFSYNRHITWVFYKRIKCSISSKDETHNI